ncbi:hypothetical protein KQX54_002589 [Cotesia glomerata]|uniref:Uncharacterized protein n=1 Tax=Cotesia glomerata TaxID=32391 RepID=A0AAV7IP64_COTGL|nr:hypothetical protein KQX54_002589 [Cotesia glomerata]
MKKRIFEAGTNEKRKEDDNVRKKEGKRYARLFLYSSRHQHAILLYGGQPNLNPPTDIRRYTRYPVPGTQYPHESAPGIILIHGFALPHALLP